MNITHIMPHMGPGPGKAVSSLVNLAKEMNDPHEHRILLTENYRNTTYIDICRQNGIWVDYLEDFDKVLTLLNESDIIQLEWWHHPGVLDWIYKVSNIPMRLMTWCHISGCNYPSISPSFINAVDQCVFTTAYSFENPNWSEKDRADIQKKAVVAPGSGSFRNVENMKHVDHEGFNIGYIGTLDFVKLNPDFVQYCASVDIPNVKFIMIGSDENKELLLQQAREYGIENKFEFTGFISDIKAQLARCDMIGYLLYSDHYGTTDNALLEVMAAGMAVIAINQCGEKYVIEHNNTGLLVNRISEYALCVRYLYENPSKRKTLGENAKVAVRTQFSTGNTLNVLHQQYDCLMNQPKKSHHFVDAFGSTPGEWFKSGLGKHTDLFENDYISASKIPEIFKGNTKSSVKHFLSYFREDEFLQRLVNSIIVEV